MQAAPAHLVVPALGRARPTPGQPGSVNRVPQPRQLARAYLGRPACAAAEATATPYDGRHTYASLRIHEGDSPLLVAAALGHATGELVWRRYAHLFEEARLAPNVAMVDAIEAARASVGASGIRPLFAQGPSRGLQVAGQNDENPLA